MNIRLNGICAIALALLGGSGLFASAGAFEIDPQCQQFPDKIPCTCALQNGGHVFVKSGQMRFTGTRDGASAVEKCIQAAK